MQPPCPPLHTLHTEPSTPRCCSQCGYTNSVRNTYAARDVCCSGIGAAVAAVIVRKRHALCQYTLIAMRWYTQQQCTRVFTESLDLYWWWGSCLIKATVAGWHVLVPCEAPQHTIGWVNERGAIADCINTSSRATVGRNAFGLNGLG